MTKPEAGRTKSVGYQVGARRTLPIEHGDAWELLTSAQGARLWLGDARALKLAPDATYSTKDGASGEVRVFRPDSHLRVTWQPEGWERPSTIQVRVIPKGQRTVVAFHQEHLPGPKERAARKAWFAAALDALERITAGA